MASGDGWGGGKMETTVLEQQLKYFKRRRRELGTYVSYPQNKKKKTE